MTPRPRRARLQRNDAAARPMVWVLARRTCASKRALRPDHALRCRANPGHFQLPKPGHFRLPLTTRRTRAGEDGSFVERRGAALRAAESEGSGLQAIPPMSGEVGAARWFSAGTATPPSGLAIR